MTAPPPKAGESGLGSVTIRTPTSNGGSLVITGDGFAFSAHVPVRSSDMDAVGQVSHARMVTLLEEARIQWLRSAGEQYGRRSPAR